jgi:hypothetical protein
MLFDDRKVRADDSAAAEGAHRQLKGQRLYQHPQAYGRSTADDREADSFFVKQLRSACARLSDLLIRRNQRAVDIGDDKQNRSHGSTLW